MARSPLVRVEEAIDMLAALDTRERNVGIYHHIIRYISTDLRLGNAPPPAALTSTIPYQTDLKTAHRDRKHDLKNIYSV